MKHKPIFRLALLALLLAGCGKDTTELPEGPETPATGGDAIVCRLSIGNEAPDPTDETRTAYGPLQDGYYPIYWRNADRVGIICPQTTPQWAEVEVSVSGATESEADLSDTGMQWGSQSQLRFLRLLPGRRRPGQQRLDRRDGNPGVQTYHNGECNMQYAYMAACTQGVERGGEVPFRFRPLMTTVTIQVGFSEAAEVQKLVLSSENGPIAGGFTFDIETDRCTVIPGKGSNVLALHLVSGDVPYIQLSAGAKVAVTAFMLPQDIEGLTLSAVTTQGRTYSYTTPATLRAGHRYSFTIGRHAGAGATDLGRLFRLDGLPARQHLPVAGFHPRVARRLHDLRFALRVQRRDAQRKIPLQMVAERRIRLYEHDQDHQGTGALHRRAAWRPGFACSTWRPSSSSSSVRDLPIHHGIAPLGDRRWAATPRAAPAARNFRPSCFRTCSTVSCGSSTNIRARRCSCI